MSQSPQVKGVILAAGYGSRFLPATKTVPKELLPLINKPCIDFIVEEFLSAGIEDILIITSRRKKALEDYFDKEIELEQALQCKPDSLTKISPANARIQFVRQQEMKGTGHALALCKNFVHDSPFVVAYPDDLVFADTSLSQQLIDVYRQTQKTVLAVKNMPNTDVSRYGVVDYNSSQDNTYTVSSLVEKPAQGTEPSKMVSIGRYLFTPEIFSIIDDIIDNPRDGEFYQTEIINILAKHNKVVALDFEGVRYDTGEPIGYLKTLLAYSMQDKEIAKELMPILEDIVMVNSPITQDIKVSPIRLTSETPIKVQD